MLTSGTCCDMLFFFAAVQSKDHTPKRCHQSSYKWHGEARQPTSKTKFLGRVELFSSCALTIVNSLPMFRMEEVKRCSNLGLSDGSFSILTSKNKSRTGSAEGKGLYFLQLLSCCCIESWFTAFCGQLKRGWEICDRKDLESGAMVI